MHITLYHPGDIPVPPKLYGGTERVIFWLGKALAQLGHRVTLLARPGSAIPGAELRLLTAADVAENTWPRLVPDDCDVLQLWGPPGLPLKWPFLVTIEGNGQRGETFPVNTVFVSRAHAANHGSRHFIYNGLDPEEYACGPAREDYAVFLAKARWSVKNFAGAVQVARRAGIELRVLGSRNWPWNVQRLLPPIRGVRYYGMLGGAAKRELLARARCLIFPVRWHEPFGIALTEALVSGCYVAGTPYGSLPEIVTPAVGTLSARADDLVAAVNAPQRYDPAACRARVLDAGLFTHLDMARRYLSYYERLLAHGGIGEPGEPAPVTRPGFVAKDLLPWEA